MEAPHARRPAEMIDTSDPTVWIGLVAWLSLTSLAGLELLGWAVVTAGYGYLVYSDDTPSTARPPAQSRSSDSDPTPATPASPEIPWSWEPEPREAAPPTPQRDSVSGSARQPEVRAQDTARPSVADSHTSRPSTQLDGATPRLDGAAPPQRPDEAQGSAAATEQEAIQQMRQRVPAGAAQSYKIFGAHEKQDDAFFLRFLVARDFDIEKSSGLMLSYLQWRRETYPNGPPLPENQKRAACGAAYLDFFDKQDHKVLVIRARYHQKKWPTEETKHVIVMWLDGALHGLREGVAQFSVLVDLEGFGYSNSDLSCLKNSLTIIDNYFPERLANMWFIHANWLFMKLWAVVKPWVAPRTAEKIHFFGAEYEQRLPELIDPQVLPKQYGGRATNPPVKFIGRLHPPGLTPP